MTKWFALAAGVVVFGVLWEHRDAVRFVTREWLPDVLEDDEPPLFV